MNHTLASMRASSTASTVKMGAFQLPIQPERRGWTKPYCTRHPILREESLRLVTQGFTRLSATLRPTLTEWDSYLEPVNHSSHCALSWATMLHLLTPILVRWVLAPTSAHLLPPLQAPRTAPWLG